MVEKLPERSRRSRKINEIIDQLGSAVPVGTVIAYYGTLGGSDGHYPVDPVTGEPNTRWHICNGETVNGVQTPDLRDRFVVGAGGSYSPGATGGASSHSHTYTQVPSHNHTMQSAGTHTHGVPAPAGNWGYMMGLSSQPIGQVVEVGLAGDHTHTLNAAGVSSPSTDSASSLPPYVALVWLMRVA